ncbi:hypothetical protein NQ317_007671 [Molorchus minor]|uniref:Uncharacterized protein n=1 Tax=Molorchus minor TaxID=1323400 RepID=A0ABQ9J342_9CUCU|nr:hypothetical protein NQ317_007671 [Molorchus minor]
MHYQNELKSLPRAPWQRIIIAILLRTRTIWFFRGFYNRRKLDELPFHYFHLNSDLEDSKYLSDILWIYDKVCGSNCYQLLEDINLLDGIRNEFTHILKDFLETHASVLNYDGRQLYSHLYKFLEDKIGNKEISVEHNNSNLSKVYSMTRNPPVLSLIALNSAPRGNEEVIVEKTFDLIIRLPKTNQFIVTISTNREEICVWDIIRF